jgi:hypothetical protein
MIKTMVRPKVGCIAVRDDGRGIKRAITAILVGVAMAAFSCHVSAADKTPTRLNIIWSFPHPGVVRFCYDKTPAVIYLTYDVTRKRTSILKRELDGAEEVLGDFPGAPDERSLSCSQDGQTIVARGILPEDGQKASLFISIGGRKSLYLFRKFWPFSEPSLYSLISPDGKSITLPEIPNLAEGPDLLKEMRIFPSEVANVHFMDGYVYRDGKNSISKFGYADGEWKKQREVRRVSDFSLNEVDECGGHDVASFVGFDSSSFLVLDEDMPPAHDWLARIGVRKLLRIHGDPTVITGSFGACVFPLHDRSAPRRSVSELVRFDANGAQIFSLPDREVVGSDDEIYFCKDGCHLLIHVFVSKPEISQFTVPHQVQLLKVQSARCR